MTSSDPDVVSYSIVVRGLHEAAYERFSRRFTGHRGGATPGPHPREIYQVVDCEVGQVYGSLSWIASEIAGRFRVVELGIGIHTPRNWSNFYVPLDVVQAAHEFGATIRLSFMSPVVR